MKNTSPNAALWPVYGSKTIPTTIPRPQPAAVLNNTVMCVSAVLNPQQQALSFIILLPQGHRLLPVLAPCAGTLNSSGRYVKQYQTLLSGLTSGLARTPNEGRLIQLGIHMLQLAVQLPGTLNAVNKTAQPQLQQLFNLWQQAFTLLVKQPFVRSYVLQQHQPLQHIPQRTRLHYCPVSTEKPVLQWVLETGKEGYRFYPQLLLNGQVFTRFTIHQSLLIHLQGCYYLPARLHDAVLLESIPCIHFAKSEYVLFEQTVLRLLQPFYTINRVTQE